jgi:hypothetical protein
MTMDVQTVVVGVCVAVAAVYSSWRTWRRLSSLPQAGTDAAPDDGSAGPAAGSCGPARGGCAGCGGGCGPKVSRTGR